LISSNFQPLPSSDSARDEKQLILYEKTTEWLESFMQKQQKSRALQRIFLIARTKIDKNLTPKSKFTPL